MRPNFAKIEWSDFVEFVDSNLTDYGRLNFAKFNSSDFVEFVDSNLREFCEIQFNSQRCKTHVSGFRGAVTQWFTPQILC